ncbi:hypothetical protein MF672_011715 [Actinomadura sp. ATCC 31491]|uniref:Uncharacterized protein n=1 Tax=Actinomadura luzonensis TaxID=2805427 RepID=A0ABT0FQ24_9ACTN|nr:hypothetical protein [Actinomadura luzonensis]MCK2214451.1 hypothetical protein [Actinomadura luzonensis]
MTDQRALDRLIALVPPPPNPRFGLSDWDELYDELGTELPAVGGDLIDLTSLRCRPW